MWAKIDFIQLTRLKDGDGWFLQFEVHCIVENGCMEFYSGEREHKSNSTIEVNQ